MSGKVAAALTAAALVAVPAIAVAQASKRPPAVSLSFDRITSFTPASADPRLAASSMMLTSRTLAVTGGVRYRVDQDRIAALSDQRRDSQAVYVGTAFKF